MPRYLDLTCTRCGVEVNDLFVMRVPKRIIHHECGGEMEQVYRPRPSRPTLEKNMAVVFRDAQGRIRYPARSDAPTPAGYERVVIPPREMESFCKAHGVLHEESNYNRGRGVDDTLPSPKLPPERERYERFLKSTEGVF
jgi:hypothetical protein